jgi:hypothetical protein
LCGVRILREGRANKDQEKRSDKDSHNRGCYNPPSGKRKLSKSLWISVDSDGGG